MLKMHDVCKMAILEAKFYTSFNFVVLNKMTSDVVAGLSNMLGSMQNLC